MTLRKDIEEATKGKRLVIGLNSVMNALKSGDVEKVVIANNCDENVKSDISRYSNMIGVKVEKFSGNNNEMGTLCKKPFSISVLAVKKG